MLYILISHAIPWFDLELFRLCSNFVVQCVIEQNDDSINAIICNCFSGFYVPMFKDKFGSRVVETLLKYCSIILLEELVSELLDNIELIELVQDQYGNYAMKALLNAIQVYIHLETSHFFSARICIIYTILFL